MMNETSGYLLYIVFMQDELDEVMRTWNSHKMRAEAGNGVIGGQSLTSVAVTNMIL